MYYVVYYISNVLPLLGAKLFKVYVDCGAIED